jgi:hypothetical protein
MWTLLALACTGAPAPGDGTPVDTAAGDDTAPVDTDPAADTDSAGDTDTGSDTDVDPDTDPDSGDTADTATPGPAYPVPCDSWGVPRDVGTIADLDHEEISGVAPSLANPGVLWILEDHGNDPAFYAIDLTGASLGTVTLEGVENVDWEAIALGPCGDTTCLWAADTGDNLSERPDVTLYRVPEPAVGWGGGLDLTVVPDVFPLVYSEGPQNVEAVALTPEGLPAFFTKRGDGTSFVYVVDALVPDVVTAPRRVATLSTRVGEEETGGVVTSADLWPDGSRLLLRTYDAAWEFDLGALGIEAAGTAARTALPHADERQVEAVAYDTEIGGYWQIPEGVEAPVTFVPCLD